MGFKGLGLGVSGGGGGGGLFVAKSCSLNCCAQVLVATALRGFFENLQQQGTGPFKARNVRKWMPKTLKGWVPIGDYRVWGLHLRDPGHGPAPDRSGSAGHGSSGNFDDCLSWFP